MAHYIMMKPYGRLMLWQRSSDVVSPTYISKGHRVELNRRQIGIPGFRARLYSIFKLTMHTILTRLYLFFFYYIFSCFSTFDSMARFLMLFANVRH
jgi:hypothetical protein